MGIVIQFIAICQHTTFGNSGSSLSSTKGDTERDFFIELWDVSGHDSYEDCRSLFYSQINGVIFVHDLSQRRTKTSLLKRASEQARPYIATTGTFTAPMRNGGPGGLLVPYIVIGNKADIAVREGPRGSSGNLVDIARQWVEKQGILPSASSEELPLVESFPGSGGLTALIRRRYFSDELPAPSNWSTPQPQRPKQRLDESLDDYDPFYKSTSLSDDPYKYNAVPPLPAQRNLMPPPTLYPQQPVSATDDYSLPRLAYPGTIEINSARSKRSDINA
uniref:Uncharacterized protein n=1 Tax=Kalanchoe fedtschenkoi TaxID=63787 RepID=A0A7N0VDH3_KALFE